MTIDATLAAIALSSSVPEAVILDHRRDLVGRRRHVRRNAPGRPGSWRWDEEPGDRNLELDVHIAAASIAARRDAVRRLAAWADVGDAQLVLSDETDRYYEAILDDNAGLDELLQYAEGTVRFVTGPYSLAIATSSELVTAAGPSPDSDSFNVGDDVNVDPVIEVTALGGTVTSLTLTVNGDALTWTGAVALTAGEAVTISSLSSTVTVGVNVDADLVGAFNVAAVDMADVAGTFPILFPGANAWSIAWTGTATDLGIRFLWRERFY